MKRQRSKAFDRPLKPRGGNPWALSLVLAIAMSWPNGISAQSFRRAGTEFAAVRTVTVPPGKPLSIVVTQFFHHGEIHEDGRNVAVVTAKGQKPVPSRVLQLGPGDYCRLAIQTVQGQNAYEVFYGGEPPTPDAVPAWTSQDGLLLETRQFRACNLNDFQAVREAFDAAKPIGADFVDAVQHSHNPTALSPAPFFSRYSGQLRIAAAATYGFMTSSQDCSFLLIDGQVVVAAPGMHGPVRHAVRGSRKDLHLAPGLHKFEYYHAVAGPSAMMVAAWEVNPPDSKPQPKAIPPELFNVQAIGREPAGPVSTRTEKVLPDFLISVSGSVPLPDNDVPLVGVQLFDVSPKGLTASGKREWDFGDGQTSAQANPSHVYLHPGLYTVKLSVRRSGRPLEIASRVYVDQPAMTDAAKAHKLDDYLKVLDQYDPATLDAAALRQMVLAYQWKADEVVAPPDGKPAAGTTADEPLTPAQIERRQAQAAARKAQSEKYLASAVAAGKAAFVGESAAKGDEDLLRLARLIGPLARENLGDSSLSGLIWLGASKRIAAAAAKAECLIQVADVALSDLATPEAAKAAKGYLDAATAQLGADAARPGPIASRLKRVWGDYFALTGDGKSARKAYAEAASLLDVQRTNAERTAWAGAHGRSTEQFIKTGELDRAAAQIRQWQDEFPADRITGYVTLL
jgi:PKD repeat protein